MYSSATEYRKLVSVNTDPITKSNILYDLMPEVDSIFIRSTSVDIVYGGLLHIIMTPIHKYSALDIYDRAMLSIGVELPVVGGSE